jgi:rare lipoprotein A
VLVTINDRGPVPEDRIIDLSPVAAAQLGMKRRGIAPVEIRRARWE